MGSFYTLPNDNQCTLFALTINRKSRQASWLADMRAQLNLDRDDLML